MSPTLPNGKQFSGANAAWHQDIGANCTLSPSTHSHPSCDCFRIKQNANTRNHVAAPDPIYVAHVHVDHMHGMQGHFRICQCASAIVPGVTSAEVSPWPWWNITKERKSFAKLCWSEPSRTTTTNECSDDRIGRADGTDYTEQPQQKRSQLWSKCIRSH